MRVFRSQVFCFVLIPTEFHLILQLTCFFLFNPCLWSPISDSIKPWNRMVPGTVPFGLLLGPSLEVDTKPTSHRKSAVPQQVSASKDRVLPMCLGVQASLSDGKVGQGKDYVKTESGKQTVYGWQNWPQSNSGQGLFVWVSWWPWWLSVGLQTMVRISKELLLMHLAVSCFRTWWPSMMWLGTSGKSGLPGHCLEKPLQGYHPTHLEEWPLQG